MNGLETNTPEPGTRTPKETNGLSPATRRSRKEASAEERRALIVESAYLKTERRGSKGNAKQDWLEAEAGSDELPCASSSLDEPPQLDW